MITALSHTTIWVLDQDEALAFYTQKLGFEVNTDATMDDFRWLTVSPPGRPEHELILLVPGPPMMDEEAAEQVKALVAKGALGPGAFETDDCRATYKELGKRGVNFLTGPTERFYGIEATFRDNSGNWRGSVMQGHPPCDKNAPPSSVVGPTDSGDSSSGRGPSRRVWGCWRATSTRAPAIPRKGSR